MYVLRTDVWNLRLKWLRDAPAPRLRKSANKLYQQECSVITTMQILLTVEYASHPFPTLGDVCHVCLVLVPNVPQTPGRLCSDSGRDVIK